MNRTHARGRLTAAPTNRTFRRLAATGIASAIAFAAPVALTGSADATTAPRAHDVPVGPSVADLFTAPSVDTTGFDAPDGYYDEAEGKTGDELKSALHEIIDDNEQLSYDELWDALCETDADPENEGNVVEVYTGNSIGCDDHGTGQDQWNREHVWAKSHGDFGTATGPGTDLHHIRPADVTVNSTRNNLDFDEGGEEVDEAPGNYYDSDSWEPRDEVKGDVARMILYMDVRYNGDDDWPDLEVNDEVENNSDPNIGRVSVLVKWSNEDPPSEFEQHRNDVIFDSYQHNRNPFIDHPEWVDEIYGSAADDTSDDTGDDTYYGATALD